MLDDVHRRRRRLAAALGVAATAGGLTAISSAPAAVALSCAERGRAAVLCLVNRERSKHGLDPLRHDRRIARAAGRHARDMVRHGYFAHQRSGGPDLRSRLRRAGWRGSAYGEAIAYGCGGRGSPRATVRSWLDSPSHRTPILTSAYRRGGAGVARRTPAGCGGRTWVLDLGRP